MTNSVTGLEVRTYTVNRGHLADRLREAIMTAGAIVPFACLAAKVPAGWLLCDGRPMRSSDHAELYAAIGTAWGNGSRDQEGQAEADPETDFNLPDLRGYFLRGLDDRPQGTVKD